MPLPDERPRQSVANLIGRFEKQKSAAGSAAPPPAFPRTSSVASHRTGDSAQEEVKEKREWPPKTAERPATSVWPPAQAAASSTPQVPKGLSSSDPEPRNPPADGKSSTLFPTPEKSTARPPPPSQTKPPVTRAASTAQSPAPKTAVKSSTSVLKPPASESSMPTNLTPLKPQHTGQSVTSTGTVTRTATKPRTSAPPKPPVATIPARARTPLSTSSTAPPKTPSTARPKTPSSGLYAPTAASLARSKTGAPTPPPAEKPKRKITTDLSKPTAASASRMRPSAPTPPTRAGKTTAPKTTVKVVARPAAKATLPAKQSGTAKPPVVKILGDQNKAVAAEQTPSKAGSTVAASVEAAAAPPVVAAEPAHPDSPTPENAAEGMTREADGTVEVESDLAHSSVIQEDLLGTDERFGLDDQDESHVGEEEIESYDEDFPEEDHEVLEEQEENGHMEVEGGRGILDDPSFVDEPHEEHGVGSEEIVHGHEDDIPTSEKAHDTSEELEKEPLQLPADSHDLSSHPRHSEDMVEPGPKDVVKANPNVGTDLEDMVNLLESGPTTLRPSVEAISSGVSDTGDIPDED